MANRFDAIPEDVREGLKRAGLEPAEYLDMFAGSVAVTVTKSFIAAKRFMHGEGHDDPLIEQFVERVLDAWNHAFGRRVQQRAIRMDTVNTLSDLTKIYREYRAGRIETQADLRDIVRMYFDAQDFELTEEGMSLLAPDRKTLSKVHRGPSQYAKHVLAELRDVHWKTIHTWAMNRDEPFMPDPYGIHVTSREVREFIDKHVDFEAARDRRISRRKHAWAGTAEVAIAGAAEMLLGRLEADGVTTPTPERVEAAKARAQALGKRPAGRPKKPRR